MSASIMTGMGFAMMGTATAGGEKAAVEAARAAILCPLLDEAGLKGARAILVNITASGNLALHDMYEACELIRAASGVEDVQINFGVVPDESLGDQVKVTVIATGFERQGLPEAEAPRVSVNVPTAIAAAPSPGPTGSSTPFDVPIVAYRESGGKGIEDEPKFEFEAHRSMTQAARRRWTWASRPAIHRPPVLMPPGPRRQNRSRIPKTKIFSRWMT